MRCEVGTSAPAAAGPPISKPEEPAPEPDSARRAEEEHMLAEAVRDEPSAPRRDPEEVALELLQSELGARRIDNG